MFEYLPVNGIRDSLAVSVGKLYRCYMMMVKGLSVVLWRRVNHWYPIGQLSRSLTLIRCLYMSLKISVPLFKSMYTSITFSFSIAKVTRYLLYTFTVWRVGLLTKNLNRLTIVENECLNNLTGLSSYFILTCVIRVMQHNHLHNFVMMMMINNLYPKIGAVLSQHHCTYML